MATLRCSLPMESIIHAQRWISAYKIQNAFREFAYRAMPPISSSTLDKNLQVARDLKHQPPNMSRAKISPQIHNIIWDSIEVDPDRPSKVSFQDESIVKDAGEVSSIETDFRVREEKPHYITVKILNKTIKNEILTPILSSTPIATLREVLDILSESFEVVRRGKTYRFLDPFSTKIDISQIRTIKVSEAKIRHFTKTTRYQNPIYQIPIIPPATIPYDPEYILEQKFKELEAKIEELKRQSQKITPPPHKPRLARTGPTMICGVPVTIHHK